jgi:phosphopantetheinyl transferase
VTLADAREKYSWLFDLSLSDESIEARYWLLEYLRQEYDYLWKLEKDEKGRPIPIITPVELYWSISHSENHIAYIVSGTPVGIDIAEIRERDISILLTHTESEYALFGGRDWTQFYILWSAKEAIIKSYGWSLDDMGEIHLQWIYKDNTYNFEFKGEMYRIKIVLQDNRVIAYTF